MSAPTPYAIIRLAKVLHDTYRAAFKSFHSMSHISAGATVLSNRRVCTIHCNGKHDHSFETCTKHGKAYFLRRATRVLREGRL